MKLYNQHLDTLSKGHPKLLVFDCEFWRITGEGEKINWPGQRVVHRIIPTDNRCCELPCLFHRHPIDHPLKGAIFRYAGTRMVVHDKPDVL